MSGYLDNSLRLTRFILRRERVMSGIWLVTLLFFLTGIAVVLNSQLSSPADLLALMLTMQSPAMVAMMGPVYGLGNYTVGAMYANEMLLMTILAVAIMNIFLVVRHTRGDEERGRLEVIRSLPAGRLANLHAALLAAVCINAALALLSGPAMSALGISSMDFGGSMLYGAVLGVSGLLFAAVAAVFSQLCATSRGASGYSFAFLGICYLVRAVGDIGNEALSLASPLGLILRCQVYVKNDWRPVGVVLLLTGAVAAAAYGLNTLRDMDQGFIPVKPGRRRASVLLRGPLGLAARLMRGLFVAWTVGMFVFGAAYGSVMGDLEAFLSQNAFFQLFLPRSPDYSPAELFIIMLNAMLALTCVVPVLMMALKLRGEEKDHRAEHILGRAVSRPRYLAGFVVMAVAAAVVMPFAAVLGLWSASTSAMDAPIAFGSMLRAMMVYVPALWVMLGMAVLVTGLLPGATAFCWAYFGYAFFATYMGRALNMPEWARKLTPFGFIPQLPLEKVNPLALAALSVVGLGLTAAGFVCYRRRDMRG